MDKAGVLKAIKDAEAKAASELEEGRARKAAAVASAQGEGERVRREGFAEADRAAQSQIDEARRGIEKEKQGKLEQGRIRVRRKRELAEARVNDVAEYLVQEFERFVQAGAR